MQGKRQADEPHDVELQLRPTIIDPPDCVAQEATVGITATVGQSLIPERNRAFIRSLV